MRQAPTQEDGQTLMHFSSFTIQTARATRIVHYQTKVSRLIRCARTTANPLVAPGEIAIVISSGLLIFANVWL